MGYNLPDFPLRLQSPKGQNNMETQEELPCQHPFPRFPFVG
jgi:hypothetical protein